MPYGGPKNIQNSHNGANQDSLSGATVIGNLVTGNPPAGTNGGLDLATKAQVHLKDISARSCEQIPMNDSACHKTRTCGISMELSYARKCKSDVIPLMRQ